MIKNQDSKFVRQVEPMPRKMKMVRNKIILIILFMGMSWITPESLIADDCVASPSSVSDLINPTFNKMLSWSLIMPDGHLPGGPIVGVTSGVGTVCGLAAELGYRCSQYGYQTFWRGSGIDRQLERERERIASPLR